MTSSYISPCVAILYLVSACQPSPGSTDSTQGMVSSTNSFSGTGTPTGVVSMTSGDGADQGCGIQPLSSFDARCVPWTLGCPASPKGPFVPIIQVGLCHFATDDRPCTPTGLPYQCPVWGSHVFETVSLTANGILVEVVLEVLVGADSSASLKWATSETDFQSNPIQQGTVALGEPCCDRQVDIALKSAAATVRLFIGVDWAPADDSFAGDAALPLSFGSCVSEDCPASSPLCRFTLGPGGDFAGDSYLVLNHFCTHTCVKDDDCISDLPASCTPLGHNVSACTITCPAQPQPCPGDLVCDSKQVLCLHKDCECTGNACMLCN